MSLSLVEAGNLIVGLLEKLATGRKVRRRELFLDHVEPLQKQFDAIHKDYVTGFREALAHIQDGVRPTSELLGFLRNRRQDFEADRQRATAIAIALAEKKNPGLSDESWASLIAYCRAMNDYFSVMAGAASVTWYSDLISRVETNVRLDLDDAWSMNSIRGGGASSLAHDIESMLADALPSAYAAVSDHYASLRATLL